MANDSLRHQLQEFLRRTLGTGALTDDARRELNELVGLCDVPGEQTADQEEAFAAEPYIRPVEPAGQQLDPRFGMLSGKRDRPTLAELEALPPEVRCKLEEQLATPEPPPQDVIDLMELLKDSLRVAAQETRRRDDLAEERVRRYVREDGTPK